MECDAKKAFEKPIRIQGYLDGTHLQGEGRLPKESKPHPAGGWEGPARGRQGDGSACLRRWWKRKKEQSKEQRPGISPRIPPG